MHKDQQQDPQSKPGRLGNVWPIKRVFFFTIGLIMTALGVIGAVLPVLPTTPFMIIAAAAFARSSPRLEKALLNHKLFGPPLRDWRERGAIRLEAKILATIVMALSLGALILWRQSPPIVIIITASLMAAGGAFVWSRPR